MTTLCAELSSNHGGSWEWILRAIDQCAAAGVDILKAQAYQTKFLRPGDPQTDWLKQAELSLDDLEHFYEACHAAGVVPMMSVFDLERPTQLADIGYTCVKIGAGDSMRADLITACIECCPYVYVSDGGLGDVAVSHAPVGAQLIRMKTQSRYPCPPECAQLGGSQFPLYTGYSDHTVGLDACKVAIVLGAWAVEKHLRLGVGRANAWDTLPAGFKELDAWRKTVAVLRGTGAPQPADPADVARFVGRWTHGG